MKIKQSLLIIISILLFSCTPKVVDPVVPEDIIEDMWYKWKMPILPDTSSSSGEFLKFQSNTQLLASSTTLTNNLNMTTISMFKVLTNGVEKQWDWSDFYSDEKQSYWASIVVGSYLYLNAKSAQYCIDLNDGTTLWRHKITGTSVDYSTSSWADKIFHIRYIGHTKSTIWMADVQDGNWQPIFSTEMQDSYSASLYPPECSINADGDTILYFQNRGYYYAAARNRTDFYAYNLSKKEVLWKLDDFPDETSNTSPPALDELNRRMYFSTHHKLFCWDMDTGEEIWSYPLEYAGILGASYLLYDGKLILKTDQGYLWAVDAATGQELYYIKQGGCCVGGMMAHNGRIYYTDQDIWINDANTGALIKRIPGKFASLPPTLDLERGLMYTMDYWYMYGIKIPE